MKVVIALGGNALLRRGDPLEAEVQRRNIAAAAEAIAPIAKEHQVVLSHGNGPQVGLLALQSDAYKEVRQYPLDVLGAESEGMIGYMLEQEISNRLPGREVVVLLTRVEVDRHDPAFDDPVKPIGPVYEEEEARRLAEKRGWSIAPDGDKFRRVVPSPQPRRIVELNTIRLLVDAGTLVVCTGGGGVPVVADAEGQLTGIEGVIDKDRAASLLARQLNADALLLLTDVDAVYDNWGAPDAKPIRRAPPDLLRNMSFDPGSMGPKVEGACDYVEAVDGIAGIGRLEDAAAILASEAGTLISSDAKKIEHHS